MEPLDISAREAEPLMEMADPELPSGTVTLLFTDIEGSTRLIDELGEEEYVRALAVHRRLLRGAFSARDGVEVDTEGDAFFYVFAEPGDALAAAAEGQKALASGPIRVRMGVHTGTLRLTGEGYAGRELHRAARIAASGHGGQVVLSWATRALVEGDLIELGEHRLKDFDEQVALFQLGSERFPPLKTISNTNLPRPASSFVGRGREREELLALMRNGARLVTLTGPGGSGKTRLALEVASELVPSFKAGVFWVGVAALRDPALVTETIAQTLGAKDGLADHIAERELLLLLDNLEQVVGAAPELSSLLEACPNFKLLVTSRELLRIAGEVDYPVPPLAEPEAVELFCQRARLKPDETIAELCRRLDDLPLAVELAAARTGVLTPVQILERLSQRLDLLKGGRDADPRQQTLRATIEWSQDLLTDEEKQLFARLAVFAGGCALEAAEEVCEADLDVLQSLIDKSLLRHTGDRFWMLETIREFQLERFEASDEAEELRRRHAEHFRRVAIDQEPRLRRLDDEAVAAMSLLSEEISNVRAALAWLIAKDPEGAVQPLRATTAFWIRGGRADEGRTWADRALAGLPDDSASSAAALEMAGRFARFAGDAEQTEALTSEALQLARARGDDAAAGRLLETLGEVAVHRRSFDSAERSFGEALPLLRAAGDDLYIAFALAGLGLVAEGRGDLDEAARLIDEAVALAESRNLLNLPPLLGGSGRIALDRGDDARAERLFRRALDLAVRWRQVVTVDSALAGIAAARAHRGDVDGALRACEAVVALPGAADALDDYADYLKAIAPPARGDRRMTVEEAIEHALADD